MDVIFTTGPGGFSDSRLYKNDGSGNYTLDPTAPFEELSSANLIIGDIDADGNVDALVQGYSYAYMNDGTGSFSQVQDKTLKSGSWAGFGMANVNGNPNIEIFITGWYQTPGFFDLRSMLFVHDGEESALPVTPLEDIIVYPNPVYDELSIDFEGTEEIDELYLTYISNDW